MADGVMFADLALLPKDSKFRLAEGEKLVVCPYDMSHVMTNLRMLNHLEKCRRNYERNMALRGEELQIVVCRFNGGHHIRLPEILFHESMCADRFSVIRHVIEFQKKAIQGEQLPPGTVEPKKRKDEFESTGVLMPENLPWYLDEEGTCKSDIIALPPSTLRGTSLLSSSSTLKRARKRQFNYVIPTMGLNTRTVYKPMKQDRFVELDFSKLRVEKKPEDAMSGKAAQKPERMFNRPSGWEQEEDWGKPEDVFEPYNPWRKFDNMPQLKYPPGLTKSERKKWKNQNIAKIEAKGGLMPQLFEPPADNGALLNNFLDDVSVAATATTNGARNGTRHNPFALQQDQEDFEEKNEGKATGRQSRPRRRFGPEVFVNNLNDDEA